MNAYDFIVIGVVYATIFNTLDVTVALVDARPTMLEFIGHEPIEDFILQLRHRGMTSRFGSKVERIDLENDCPVTLLEGGRCVRLEMVLYMAGRAGETNTLNRVVCGLTTDGRGWLKVTGQTFQTDIDHIYAAGDAIGFPRLASASMEQGRIAAVGIPTTAAAMSRSRHLPKRLKIQCGW